MNAFEWLQEWHISQCDGDWEFRYGIKIFSVSNPGWSVEIDVSNTHLEEITIPFTKFEETKTDWYGYLIEDSLFIGSGDSTKLEVIIDLFRNIIEKKEF